MQILDVWVEFKRIIQSISGHQQTNCLFLNKHQQDIGVVVVVAVALAVTKSVIFFVFVLHLVARWNKISSATTIDRQFQANSGISFEMQIDR